jgi:hypothetical protein
MLAFFPYFDGAKQRSAIKRDTHISTAQSTRLRWWVRVRAGANIVKVGEGMRVD